MRDLRFAAYPMPCSKNTASAAGSAMMPSKNSLRKNGRRPPITKSRSSSGSRAPTSCWKSRPPRSGNARRRGSRRRRRQTITRLRETLWSAQGHAMARENASPSLLYAQEHIFERVSVARDHELLTEALRHGRGRIALEETKGVLQLEESSGRLFRAGQGDRHPRKSRPRAADDREPSTAGSGASSRWAEIMSSSHQIVCGPSRSRQWNSCSLPAIEP